eukprot:TRINITY_DN79447_c0_g1_i1.p1 TRINITY_DN79447_c0_g1~~TRINITY_DN79447_c0_g1_i1.p1  ORF type:complete len:170 (+),score=38.51 TRINITY_DN79447_c0_g1_i1:52-510(+)
MVARLVTASLALLLGIPLLESLCFTGPGPSAAAPRPSLRGSSVHRPLAAELAGHRAWPSSLLTFAATLGLVLGMAGPQAASAADSEERKLVLRPMSYEEQLQRQRADASKEAEELRQTQEMLANAAKQSKKERLEREREKLRLEALKTRLPE